MPDLLSKILTMKIRIYDNRVRLRLDRAEVDAISQTRPVVGQTVLPGGAVFRYVLRADSGAQMTASFNGQEIGVLVPAPQLMTWASDDTQISLQAVVGQSPNMLELLVEKDFECLEPRSGENQDNRFKNPKAKGPGSG